VIFRRSWLNKAPTALSCEAMREPIGRRLFQRGLGLKQIAFGSNRDCHRERKRSGPGNAGRSTIPGSPRRYAPRDDDSTRTQRVLEPLTGGWRRPRLARKPETDGSVARCAGHAATAPPLYPKALAATAGGASSARATGADPARRPTKWQIANTRSARFMV
jgi:hypothetical protein